MVVALRGGGAVEGHRQRHALERRRVEHGHPDRAVAADLHVRLDRPDPMLPLLGRPGHVHEVRGGLRSDEHGSAGERHEAEDARVAGAAAVASVGVDDGDAAAGRGVLLGGGQRPGQREQLLVIAVAAHDERSDERGIHPERSRVARLEGRRVEEDDLAGRRAAGDDRVRTGLFLASSSLVALDGADVADPAEGAVDRSRAPRRCPPRRSRCRRSRGAGSDRTDSDGTTISSTVSRPDSIGGPAGGARPSGEASRPASS